MSRHQDDRRRPVSALERRALQTSVLIGSIVPIAAGLSGAIAAGALTGDTLSPSADSHWRYLSGLLLGIGFGFLSTIPSIETKTARFRLLTLLVFIGGICRVAALWAQPWPSVFMLAGAIMEVVVTPLLCVWQTRVAHNFAAQQSVPAPSTLSTELH